MIDGIIESNYVFTNLVPAATTKSLQSCPTLCDPIEGSPSGSPIPGILQARTLEWVGIAFSNAWKWKVKVKLLSRFQLLATPWTAAHQTPPSMGFSRREYWISPLLIEWYWIDSSMFSYSSISFCLTKFHSLLSGAHMLRIVCILEEFAFYHYVMLFLICDNFL